MPALKQTKRSQLESQLLAILCSGLLVISCLHEVREISQKRFMAMMKDHDVQQITIVNGKIVEVWLKPYALTKSRYNNMFSNRKSDEPHFQMHIVSEEAFRQDLAELSPKFSISSEKRQGLFGI